MLMIPVTSDVATPNENVRRQYETFPYPFFGDPSSDEDFAHLTSPTGHVRKDPPLLQINHFIYGGELLTRRKPSTTNPLRVLIAGGGTGLDTLRFAFNFEAEQIAGSVTHVEISQNSNDQAKAWVSRFGLTHRVTFIHDSLQHFAAKHEAAGEPLFDVIHCSGVLHHLEDPNEGLYRLRRVLRPDGGMYVMVYGKHGRTGIYDMQMGLRYALPPNEALDDKIRIQELRSFLFKANASSRGAETVLSLPPSNILANNPAVALVGQSDIELFDMLLHAQDRAYSVLEFDEFVRSAGLRIMALYPEAQYEPNYTIFTSLESRSSYMARRVQERSILKQFHFTELMTSRPTMHQAYLVYPSSVSLLPRQERWRRRQEDPEWRYNFNPTPTRRKLPFTHEHVVDGMRTAMLRDGKTFQLNIPDAVYTVHLLPLSLAFWEAARFGNSSADAIIRSVRADMKRLRPIGSDATLKALSYKEVAGQMFQWLDQLEATGYIVCLKA